MRKIDVRAVVVTAAITVLFLVLLRMLAPRVPGLSRFAGLI